MDESIQLGDFGVGFQQKTWDKKRCRTKIVPTNFYASLNHVFCRGNHDNPLVCKNHPNCLSTYGIYKNIFYIAGAYSIDWGWRTNGIDWWSDEELSADQLYRCLDIFEKTKPNIVVSHECPQRVLSLLHSNIIPTRTGQALDAMFEVHQPKYWFFGHHHVSWKGKVGQTEFQCLNELEVVCINELIQPN